MHLGNKTLCLFTAEFPYGNKSETFIETEINYLSEQFTEILIFPSVKSNIIRKIPANVKVVDIVVNISMNRTNKVFTLTKNAMLVLRILYSEISDKGLKRSLQGSKILLDYLAQQIIISNILKKYFLNDFKNKVFYDYWFCDKVLALSILKFRNKELSFISRGHRYDIYDECWENIGVPFRAWKIHHIDSLFIISKFGQNYVQNKLSSRYHDKIKLSRLGVEKQDSKKVKKTSHLKTIVSCSSMLSFKMVAQIPILLKEINEPIKWYHFGDGIEMENVEKACQQLPFHIEYQLMGHVENEKVLEFYRKNQVDLFISLSNSEGLPVSMMEALSFSIPIAAVPVGGILEIVIEGLTGFLFNEPDDLTQCANILNKALNYSFNKDEIEEFFNNHFNANYNYNNFCNSIKNAIIN